MGACGSVTQTNEPKRGNPQDKDIKITSLENILTAERTKKYKKNAVDT